MNPPPILRALASQTAVFAILMALRGFVMFHAPIPLWVSLQALGSAVLGRRLGLGPYWMLFQIVLPLSLAFHLGHSVPLWLYPSLLAILLLIYGGGLFSRVPLYNSRLEAWDALSDLIPENEDFTFIDLGAGLGGPLAHIAKHRPRAMLLGIEASPLVWLIGWLRTLRYKPRCVFRFGSIWKADLSDAQMVYAFLSPAPMHALWSKVRREMGSGSLFVSHSFEAPGQIPDRRIPLPGKKGSALLVYRI